jgi:hypothetical protein
MTDLNIDTNLPVLPEGLFWKVKFDTTEVGDYYSSTKIKIPTVVVGAYKKEEKGRLFKKTIDVEVDSMYNPLTKQHIRTLNKFSEYNKDYPIVDKQRVLDPKHYPELIQALAYDVVHKIEADEKERQETEALKAALKSAQDHFSGDYPPKRLELG